MNPYPLGSNFTTSSAINQLEMWQAETFDPAGIDRELGWAAGLGMNTMRVYLHDLLWEQDAPGFCGRIDRYLAIAQRHGIRTLFVIFDDCWNPDFALGPQPKPKPFQHNSGWIQSPGKRVVNDPAQWPRLQRYVTGLLERFKDDPRISGWDLYNEPGNGADAGAVSNEGKQGKGSLPLLREVFAWARSVEGLTQPLTVGVWNSGEGYAELNAFSIEHSDFISFHCYEGPQVLEAKIKDLEKHGKALLCTEYMARGAGSTFAACLPVLRRHQVGALNWGLVCGKIQTQFPWGWNAEKGEPPLWFHDVFKADGTLLYAEERAVFQACPP